MECVPQDTLCKMKKQAWDKPHSWTKAIFLARGQSHVSILQAQDTPHHWDSPLQPDKAAMENIFLGRTSVVGWALGEVTSLSLVPSFLQ